jgi:hypothetical protein
MKQVLFLTDLPKDKSLVYFFASWFPMHSKMVRVMEKLEGQMSIPCFMIDVSMLPEKPKLPSKISVVPTVALYLNDTIADTVEGVQLMSVYRATFRNALNQHEETNKTAGDSDDN